MTPKLAKLIASWNHRALNQYGLFAESAAIAFGSCARELAEALKPIKRKPKRKREIIYNTKLKARKLTK